MNKTQSNKLATEKISKLLFSMAVPAITAQIINLLYNIVDRIYIGHIADIGTTALTGVGVVVPIITILTAFSSLVGMGGAPQAAIAMGQGNNEKAEKILGTCVSTIVGVSAILTAVLLFFGEEILWLIGASEDTIGYSMQYLGIYCVGTIFIQFVLAINPFITTQGFASISMRTTLLGAVTNIILDPIFIFVFGLGVRGAAIATILSQLLSAIWVLKFLTGKKTMLKIKKPHLKIDFKLLLVIFALGVSPFIMQSTESILTISFNTSLGKYGGDLAVGAMTILFSCMQLVTLPLMGLTQGAQPIVSFNYGAGNIDRVKKAFKILLISCFVFSFTVWSIMMIFPQVFVGLFSSDDSLITLGCWAIRIYMFATGFFGLQMACQQTFIALGQAKSSIFIALLRKVIMLIPLIYILPNIMTDSIANLFNADAMSSFVSDPTKVFAVFVSEPIADTISIIVTLIVFSITFKRIVKELEQSKKLSTAN